MKLYSKVLLLLLTIAMLTTALVFPVSAKHETVKADGFETVRGAGMLIIYTTNMGETTNTNEWGYEVIIENNVAVKYNKPVIGVISEATVGSVSDITCCIVGKCLL